VTVPPPDDPSGTPNIAPPTDTPIEPPPPIDPPAPPPASGVRPGASTFTIEGRAAPGLFVLGWLATLVGLGAVVIGVMSGPGPAIWLVIVGLVVLSIGLVAGAGGQAIERRARAVHAYTGPSPFLVFAAGIPITGLVGIGAGVVLDAVGIPVDGPVARLIAVVLQAVVYIGLIRLLVVDTGSLSWTAMGITRPSITALRELGLGMAWAIPVFAATVALVAVVAVFVSAQPESPLPPTGELGGFLLNLLAGVIVAPISEEIMFRAFAMSAWLADLPAGRAIVRGALFFAAVHILGLTGVEAGTAIAGAFVAFVARIPVALVLGWLFARRRSIWAPLGLHAAFNGVLLVLAEVAARTGIPQA
jgi:membrane protease YdiL (CAAX protease family)